MVIGFNVDLPAAALGRPVGHAAPDRRVPRRAGSTELQRRLHDRLLRPRAGRAGDGLSTCSGASARGAAPGPDPWRANTLEWFTPSPPPEHNFDVIPTVRSLEPMKDIRRCVQRARGSARRSSNGSRPSRRHEPPRKQPVTAVERCTRPGARRFRRLAYLTAALTFALIIVGGVVRISDSGLGCGAGGQRHRGLAAVRRRRRAADRHQHDRRVHAPRSSPARSRS